MKQFSETLTTTVVPAAYSKYFEKMDNHEYNQGRRSSHSPRSGNTTELPPPPNLSMRRSTGPVSALLQPPNQQYWPSGQFAQYSNEFLLSIAHEPTVPQAYGTLNPSFGDLSSPPLGQYVLQAEQSLERASMAMEISGTTPQQQPFGSNRLMSGSAPANASSFFYGTEQAPLAFSNEGMPGVSTLYSNIAPDEPIDFSLSPGFGSYCPQDPLASSSASLPSTYGNPWISTEEASTSQLGRSINDVGSESTVSRRASSSQQDAAPIMEGSNYRCPVEGCRKVFNRSYNYRAHLETHDENRVYPFKCPLEGCDKEFRRKTDLQRHHQSVHVKQREHQCDICLKNFSRKDTLRRHREDCLAKRNQPRARVGATLIPNTPDASRPT